MTEATGPKNIARGRAARRAEREAAYWHEVSTAVNGLVVRPLTPEDIAGLERARQRRLDHPEGR